jgi:hypothetical protein
MAVRNRRSADSNSDDVEHISENMERAGKSAAEEGYRTAEEARKAVEHTTDRTLSAALTAFDAFNKPMVKVMNQNRVIFQKMMHAMQEESVKFVSRRLEHMGRAIEHTRDCHGVSGLMAVQQEYLLDLAWDYAEQTRRFADLVRELAEDGSAQLSESANAMTEPVRSLSGHTEQRSGPEHRAAAE